MLYLYYEKIQHFIKKSYWNIQNVETYFTGLKVKHSIFVQFLDASLHLWIPTIYCNFATEKWKVFSSNMTEYKFSLTGRENQNSEIQSSRQIVPGEGDRLGRLWEQNGGLGRTGSRRFSGQSRFHCMETTWYFVHFSQNISKLVFIFKCGCCNFEARNLFKSIVLHIFLIVYY